MTKPFKLAAPKAIESQIQAQILDWLRVEQAAGRVSWFCRVNGGLATYGRFKVKNYILHLLGVAPVSKGYPDIHGMLKGGRYFALEVKQPGEKPTPEQGLFLAIVRADGGLADVVYGFEDVEQLLQRGGAVAARGSHKPEVAGSSPAPATTMAGVAQ